MNSEGFALNSQDIHSTPERAAEWDGRITARETSAYAQCFIDGCAFMLHVTGSTLRQCTVSARDYLTQHRYNQHPKLARAARIELIVESVDRG